jgi:hypothetical protein
MAVGDIINVYISSGNYYQPSSGVEIMVLKSFGGSPTGFSYGIYNGTNNVGQYFQGASTGIGYDQAGIGTKFGVTNSFYYYNSSSHTKGFSGIQVK